MFPIVLFKKMYNVRPKLIIIIVLVVLFTTLYIMPDTNYRMYENEKKSKISSSFNLALSPEGFLYESSFPTEPFKEIIIHLDLKGAPPKVSFLLDFIPFVKKLGATGLLLEYEDMFPYHGDLEDIKALNAYTLSDISLINESAKRNNLTIIPLVQTFGHFEFVLKLEKYRSYREVDSNPLAFCPNQRNSIDIVQKMISQVMNAHPESNYFHMGCDSVHQVGMCSRCKGVMKRNKWRKEDIYFDHVKKIARYIRKKRPWVRPIVWGNQFNKKNERLVLSLGLPQMVDVMLSNYQVDPAHFSEAFDMNSYARVFESMWVASTFKGNEGMTKMITTPMKHYTNNKGWMYFASQWKNQFRFKGILITGWQRYHHFSALCELLPVAIPSLAISLQALTEEKGSNLLKLEEVLQCNEMPPLSADDVIDMKLLSKLKCDFLGFDVYYYIHLLNVKLQQARKALNAFTTGDLFLYSILSNFSDPFYVREISDGRGFKKFLDDINELEHKIRSALSEVYDENTVTEWVFTNILPYQLRLEAATKILDNLSIQKTWSKRPFSNSESSVRHFFKRICGPLERRGCAFLTLL